MSDERDDAPNVGKQSADGDRSVFEWITFGVSAALVLAVAALVAYLSVIGDAEPPVIEARPRLTGVWTGVDGFYLPIDVENKGDRTAAEVVIETTLATGSGEETAEFTIAFLAGSETTTGIVFFTADPRSGEPTAQARSFRIP